MFSTLKRLYTVNLFSKTKLQECVKVKWITDEQYTEITGEELPKGTD